MYVGYGNSTVHYTLNEAKSSKIEQEKHLIIVVSDKLKVYCM